MTGLLNVTQAAAFLCMDREVFRTIAKRDGIPWVPRGLKHKMNRTTKKGYWVKDLEAWIQAHRINNEEEARKFFDGRRHS